MLVYRVETEYGRGPFFERDWVMDIDDIITFGDMMVDHLNDETHPLPPPHVQNEEYHFGCDSVEFLKLWFTHDMLTLLAKYNYMVKVFNVKTVERVSAGGQIAFKHRNAVEVETHPITILA